MEPSRADFCHPFQPYGIQLQFMKDLYQTINEGKVGIFESPTGTGKSLSLICGSLTWLRDHKRSVLEGSTENVEPGDDPDWMIDAERQERRRAVLKHREELERRLSEVRRQEIARRKRLSNQVRSSKKLRTHQPEILDSTAETGDFEFLPEECASDGITEGNGYPRPAKDHDALSSNTQALLAKLNGVKRPVDQISASKETRIIFCSRTHSQLTQFVKELRRVKPPVSITSLDENGVDESLPLQEEVVKHLCLGSRKNLCINHKVSRLGSVAAINERCLDLQKPGVPEERKCPFLPKKDNEDLIDSFRDHALAEVHDIEDLSNIGRSMGVCPYYASRAAIDSTEILTLPYPLLLQKSAREALGVSVKDHVVIIDEAHNLMDAITDTYSCSVSLRQVETATSQVMVYVQKFKDRLKGQNRMYITQLIRLLNSISDFLRSTASKTRENEAIITSGQLLSGKGVDQIQPHKLISYLQESKLAHKVEEYVQYTDEAAKGGINHPHERGALQVFQSFIAVLMNPSSEGRFFFSRDEDGRIQARYTLLDPREHFRDIVEEARAVILAGGTMSPMSDYKDHLFSYLPPERLKAFSFGHVVPRENIFAQSVSTGPSGVEFDFTFEKRKSEKTLIELGRLFISACRVIPDGVVAFFPSYDFLSHVVTVWKKTPLPSTNANSHNTSAQPSATIFSTLNAVKPIFYETKKEPHQAKSSPQSQTTKPEPTTPPHRTSSSLPPAQESLLQSYTRTIDQNQDRLQQRGQSPNPNPNPHPTGALLLSVTSGSLSEGINFSDRLARAVLAIGLPYPNPYSAAWKAKLQHVEHAYLQTHPDSPPPASKRASREYYENTTLRTVNQAVGRAIRHRSDYAAILLVDRRWEGGGVRGKLPAWIRGVMDGGGAAEDVGTTMGKRGWAGVEEGLRGFFEGKGGE